MAVAALEQHFRQRAASEALSVALKLTRPARLRQLPAGTTNRTIRLVHADDDKHRDGQLRFRALLLRRAYPLSDYLPVDAVLNLRRVDIDPQWRHVLLTLHTGTQLLDTGDRITVRGEADDVAVNELVACCERRGWTEVEVFGDDEFRMAASRELLRQGIGVVDCPLSEEEQDVLRAGGLGFHVPESVPSGRLRP